MEELEEANRSAIDSFRRVLNLVSQEQQLQLQQNFGKNLLVETGEAVSRFKKVVSLLGNGNLGHGRVRLRRIHRRFPNPQHQKLFLEAPFPSPGTPSDQPLQKLLLLPRTPNQLPPKIFMDYPFLEMDPSSRTSQFHHQHQQQQQQQQKSIQMLQLQHQMKLQEMYRRTSSNNNMSSSSSKSAINLKFETSSCTPTLSSNMSFLSSLSMDGSVTKVDPKGGFQLMGLPPQSSSERIINPQQTCSKKRCSGRGDDGSGKCGTSAGRCHCSKRRFSSFLLSFIGWNLRFFFFRCLLNYTSMIAGN